MILTPKCWKRNCVHLIGVKQPDNTELTECVYCKAFPDGIPASIAYGSNKHETPLPDQGNEIVYEERKK